VFSASAGFNLELSLQHAEWQTEAARSEPTLPAPIESVKTLVNRTEELRRSLPRARLPPIAGRSTPSAS
jgi:hypothetical protein